MPNIYQIELNLKGDLNAKLDDAIKKAQNLKSITNNIGGRGGSFNNPAGGRRYNPYPHIPESYMRDFRRLNYWLYRKDGLSNRGLFSNIDRAFQARQRLTNNFIANSFTYSGWQRNLGNFANLIGAVGKAALQAVPLIKPLIGAIGAIGGVAGGIALGGGLLYRFGKNQLLSESTAQAISNSAQYRMAQLGQGTAYSSLYNTATRITEQTGGSRAGLVSLMNTLSGLTLGNTKLTQKDAQWFGEVAAKISAVSGRDLQLVGLNLQQLLTTWQGIDMKELFKAVPLIEKYVFGLRAQSRNKGEDIYSFIRENPQALIEAFSRFMTQFQLPKVGVVKGRMQLSDENLEIKKLEYLERFYEDVGNVYQNINFSLEKLYQSLGSNYEGSIYQDMLTSFDNFVYMLTKTISGIANTADGFVKSIRNVFNGNALMRFFQLPQYIQHRLSGHNDSDAWKYAQADWNRWFGTGVDTSKYKGNIYRDLAKANLLSGDYLTDKYSMNEKGILSPSTSGQKIRFRLNNNSVEYILNKLENSPLLRDRDLLERISKGDKEAKWEAIKLLVRDSSSSPKIDSVGDETGRMKDLSKGSKSLIINFNKSIVDMDNHINTTDPSTIMREIEDYVSQAIARGLNIAFNQATPLT
jgi:hypothetical protein